MSEEILFRRAGFGGFNRDDVMQYISTLSAEKDKKEKAEKELSKAESELQRLRAEVDSLKAELDKKNTEIAALRPNTDVKNEPALSAERLMQDSMAYSERYIKSAELVADKIKKDTLGKLSDISSRLVQMRDMASQLSVCSEKFNLLLEKLAKDINESSAGLEQKKEDAE